MSAGEIAAAAREMLMMTLWLMSPILLAATVTSLLVGLLQAATRVNDLTLSFAPRFLVTMLAVYFAASWSAERMIAYIERAVAAAGAIGR